MDDIRESFEAWCKSKALSLQRNASDGSYYAAWVFISWEAWQESAKAEREACAQACIAQQSKHGLPLHNAGLQTAFSVIRDRNITQGDG